MTLKESEDDPSNAMGQYGGVEIQDKTDTKTSHSEIRQYLGRVNGVEAIDGLHFDDDGVRNDEVRPVFREQMAFVEEGNADLTRERQIVRTEFKAESGLINRLEQTRSQMSMNLDGASQNLLS